MGPDETVESFAQKAIMRERKARLAAEARVKELTAELRCVKSKWEELGAGVAAFMDTSWNRDNKEVLENLYAFPEAIENNLKGICFDDLNRLLRRPGEAEMSGPELVQRIRELRGKN